MIRLSLTARLTLLFGLVSSSILLGLGAVIASSLQKHFADQDREVLAGKVMLVHHLVERVASRDALQALAEELRDAFIGHPDLAVLARAPDDRVLFETDAVHFPSDALRHPRDLTHPVLFEWDEGKRKFRGIAVAIKTGIQDAPPALVAVAVDINPHLAFMATFRQTLTAFVIGAALLSGVLGWLAVRRGLAPVRAMRERAAKVTASRLDQRLPVDTVPVEFADLATQWLQCYLSDAERPSSLVQSCYPIPLDRSYGMAKHTSHPEIIKRLKRAEGHLRSVVAMLETGRPCLDIAQQLQAVESAISNAKKTLVHDHIDHCLEHAVRQGTERSDDSIREFKAITKYL